ncbi:hypothetical protein [Mycolicibacterium hassiacum]|uniref:hypothetical protein n=1 Tax=Mycolicibacterium hassiacum TaxID=46351 RepID=UPI000F4BCF32|nr:hypothetical protein [Mycolicibacterium hassiacum]
MDDLPLFRTLVSSLERAQSFRIAISDSPARCVLPETASSVPNKPPSFEVVGDVVAPPNFETRVQRLSIKRSSPDFSWNVALDGV